MKKLISVLMVLVVTIGLASAASAKDQLPNGEVYLGMYDAIAYVSEYSDYCTATQSHINLVIAPSSGSSQYIAQYRKPNGAWTDMSSTWKNADTSATKTENISAIKGYDYRLRIQARNLTTSGVVTCW